MSPAASVNDAGDTETLPSVFLSVFSQQGQACICCCSCLKGWLQALGVGSGSLMVFQWVFVRSDCAPPGGLRSSPRVIYYLAPPPAALRLRGRCQQRRRGGGRVRGDPAGRGGEWKDRDYMLYKWSTCSIIINCNISLKAVFEKINKIYFVFAVKSLSSFAALIHPTILGYWINTIANWTHTGSRKPILWFNYCSLPWK